MHHALVGRPHDNVALPSVLDLLGPTIVDSVLDNPPLMLGNDVQGQILDGALDGIEEAARHRPRGDGHRDRQKDDGGEGEDQRCGGPGHGWSQRQASALPGGRRRGRPGLGRGARWSRRQGLQHSLSGPGKGGLSVGHGFTPQRLQFLGQKKHLFQALRASYTRADFPVLRFARRLHHLLKNFL